jgi:hypothetical protein
VNGTDFTLLVGSTPVAGSVAVLSSTQARFTPSARLVPGQTYSVTLSSAIKDLAGNSLVPYSKAIRTSTTVQENSPAVGEAWARWVTSSASGGAMKIARRGGAKLTLGFDGTSISLLGARGTSGGYASVYIDGVLKTSSASFYASSTKYRQTIYKATGLAAGHHTLTVMARGTKPSASKSTWVYVDAFVTAGGTVQETAATTTFRHVTTSSASGGGYDLIDFVAATGKSGPTLTFQFKGTGITWYGTKGTAYGKAVVYIDGVKKTTVDLYRSSTAYRQAIYATTSLSNAVHTIRIVVAGSKRSTSKGYDVSFDYFAIR